MTALEMIDGKRSEWGREKYTDMVDIVDIREQDILFLNELENQIRSEYNHYEED